MKERESTVNKAFIQMLFKKAGWSQWKVSSYLSLVGHMPIFSREGVTSPGI